MVSELRGVCFCQTLVYTQVYGPDGGSGGRGHPLAVDRMIFLGQVTARLGIQARSSSSLTCML